MKTGEVYKDDNDWKSKGIPESDIRKDVKLLCLALIYLEKQNRIVQWP